ADRLANLRQKLVFLRATLGVMHDHIIFKRQPNLQGQTDQEPQIGITEQAPLGVRKKNDAEIVFTRLQADRGGVMNVLRKKRFTELLEAPSGECRERLVHIPQISKRRKSST